MSIEDRDSVLVGLRPRHRKNKGQLVCIPVDACQNVEEKWSVARGSEGAAASASLFGVPNVGKLKFSDRLMELVFHVSLS